MLPNHGYEARASRGVPVYAPALDGTKFLLGDGHGDSFVKHLIRPINMSSSMFSAEILTSFAKHSSPFQPQNYITHLFS